MSRRLLIVACVALAAGCGGSGGSPEVAVPEARPVTAGTNPPGRAAAPAATTGPVGTGERLDRPAEATESAERIYEPATIAWIGGSDVVWEDRSLPAAVGSQVGRVGTRPAEFRAVTQIGPLPEQVIDLVDTEVAAGVDGLILAMNVSWAGWGGTPHCDDVEGGPYAFYACILEPLPPAERADRERRVQRLVDVVVDSGLPAFVYLIPHSTQALTDPVLAPRIAAAEAFIASFDPGIDRIEFGTSIPTRGVTGADEGSRFLDMVHPSPSGVGLLADLLAPPIESFFADQLN